MLVGIYARYKLSVYVFHIRSSSCGGMNLCSFYLPMWFGCVSVSLLMVCCMVGSNLISSI